MLSTPQSATQTETAAELLDFVSGLNIAPVRSRQLKYAINRVCTLAGCTPSRLQLNVNDLRRTLVAIRSAKHSLSKRTAQRIRYDFAVALELADVIQRLHPNVARQHPAWGPLISLVSHGREHANGLATFAKWCATEGILPKEVTDQTVVNFHAWLASRTLHPNTRELVSVIPKRWNDARIRFEDWPNITLGPISFKARSKNLPWGDLSDRFHSDLEDYLAMRAEPDLFDARPNAPARPLATATLRQLRVHLRLAASILAQSGVPVERIVSLADLVEPEALKAILRHYYNRAHGKPNQFIVGLSNRLLQVAAQYVDVDPVHLAELKSIAAKLPRAPYHLSAKNQSLLRQFDSARLKAKLFDLPEQLLNEVRAELDVRRLPIKKAQVAIAVDILLVAPIRAKYLPRLSWREHFIEPDGPWGSLSLQVPASERRRGRQDLYFELLPDVAGRLRWYRRHFLPHLTPDREGYLFVTQGGTPKAQASLTHQMVSTIRDRLGVHVTPCQFRHFAADNYLKEHPADFETVRALLGYAKSASARVYAGSSSHAYSAFVFDKYTALNARRGDPNKEQPIERGPECAQ